MDFKSDLLLIIKNIKQDNDYEQIGIFLKENISKLTSLDDNTLKECIYLILKYSSWRNIEWINNPVLKNDRIQKEIIDILSSKEIYAKTTISFYELYPILDIKNFNEEFIEKISKIDLLSSDTLIIGNIIYNINKDKAKEYMDKRKNTKYTAYELNKQIEAIVKKKNFDFLYSNLSYLIDQCNVIELYQKIQEDENCNQKISEYIIRNIDRLIRKNYLKAIEYLDTFSNNEIVLKEIIKYINNNFDVLMSGVEKSIDYFEIKREFDKHRELTPQTKKFFKENKKQIINNMYNSANYLFIHIEENENPKIIENRKIVINILELIIDELCQKENVKFEDIKKIGEGVYSSVYQIGNKVIKIGMDRNTRKIPDNPYIIRPLLRNNFLVDENNEFGEQLFIEVTEKVLPLEENEQTEEILYELYSNLRNHNIEWLDIKVENVGMLEKDNIIYWPRELKPSRKILGLSNPTTEEQITLKKGSYVLIDADLLYTEEEFNSKYNDYSNLLDIWKKFHKRYNEEHNIGSKERK